MDWNRGSGSNLVRIRSNNLTWHSGQWYHFAFAWSELTNTLWAFRDGKDMNASRLDGYTMALNVTNYAYILGGYYGGSAGDWDLNGYIDNPKWHNYPKLDYSDRLIESPIDISNMPLLPELNTP